MTNKIKLKKLNRFKNILNDSVLGKLKEMKETRRKRIYEIQGYGGYCPYSKNSDINKININRLKETIEDIDKIYETKSKKLDEFRDITSYLALKKLKRIYNKENFGHIYLCHIYDNYYSKMDLENTLKESYETPNSFEEKLDDLTMKDSRHRGFITDINNITHNNQEYYVNAEMSMFYYGKERFFSGLISRNGSHSGNEYVVPQFSSSMNFIDGQKYSIHLKIPIEIIAAKFLDDYIKGIKNIKKDIEIIKIKELQSDSFFNRYISHISAKWPNEGRRTQ